MDTLLVVEDRFLISGRGLVLAPELSLSREGFQAFSETVRIVRPDGRHSDQTAQFLMMHVRGIEGSGRWRVVILLADAEVDDVPIGSEVQCPVEVRVRLGS